MKIHTIEINGKQYEIKQDEDGRFIKPQFLKQLEGIGTQNKPSHEPIILIQKPISEKTIADNVLKWGTGGLNIDETRIGDEEIQCGNAQKGTFAGEENKDYFKNGKEERIGNISHGRFPANSITEEPDEFYSKYFNITPKEISKKASKKDRNSDYLGNEIHTTTTTTTDGRKKPIDNAYNRGMTERKNNHPTVKSIPLMEHLIKMITPYNGVVFDPFLGSGTTIVAARRLTNEHKKYVNLQWIGSELEHNYYDISRARIFPEEFEEE